jgi:hypothetical protein
MPPSPGSYTNTNPDNSSRDDRFAPSCASTDGDADADSASADDSTDVSLDLEGSTSGDSSYYYDSNNPPLLTSRGGTGGDPALSKPWGVASGTLV